MIGRVVACKEYGKPFAIVEYEVHASPTSCPSM